MLKYHEKLTTKLVNNHTCSKQTNKNKQKNNFNPLVVYIMHKLYRFASFIPLCAITPATDTPLGLVFVYYCLGSYRINTLKARCDIK